MSRNDAQAFPLVPLLASLALAAAFWTVGAVNAGADEKEQPTEQQASEPAPCEGEDCLPQVKNTRPGNAQSEEMQPPLTRTDTTGGTEGTFADFER